MIPLTITITTELAEQICRLLETLEREHYDITSAILGAEIRGLIAPDVEAPEPPPELEEIELGLEVPEPEEPDVEAEEPDPDALDDDEREKWQEYNAEVEPEDRILECRWREYYADTIE